ncbi:glycosyltransferase family 4 protein [Leeuwenhoekiella sp. NPDC079379]|uniref:glycosyltransferase family 4 protein n=1 Tax=Leeuwenhoekiella sp. NPDC079379 TaxID=3364122 RepID=UPI0037CAA5C3
MLLFLLPALIAFAMTFAIGQLLCKPFFAQYFLAETGGEKLHKTAVPASGGIALFFGIFCTALAFEGDYLIRNHLYLLLGFSAMFLLGLVDDLKSLGWLPKLFFQILIISLVVIFADLRLQSVLLEHSFFQIPYYISVILSIVLLTFFTNAFNFIDGIDGLATTVALLFILGLLYFQIPFSSVFLMCVGAALFGFRRINKEPAALFMGDSGSLFLGFLCAAFLIIFIEADLTASNTRLESYQQRLPIIVALFWYPIFDTIRVLIIRILSGTSVFKRDRLHSYSLLLRVGYSHTQIVILVVFLTLIQVAAVLFIEPKIGLTVFFLLQIVFWLLLHLFLNLLIKNFKRRNLKK